MHQKLRCAGGGLESLVASGSYPSGTIDTIAGSPVPIILKLIGSLSSQARGRLVLTRLQGRLEGVDFPKDVSGRIPAGVSESASSCSPSA